MSTVRCCAVAFALEPSRAESVDGFLRSVAELLDRHVEPHAGAPCLVAFPEHTGLVAAFAGSRGAEARRLAAAGSSSLEILTALAVAHGDALGHYAQAFPGTTSPGRLLHLALTDTLVRSVVEGFERLARERGLWLSVGAALPVGWERVTDERVSMLADPDGGHDHAYVATSPEVRNRNLVFAPDGGLATIQDKAYLVPMERDEAAGLGLSAAGLDEVAVADLPIGRVASVVSKDAWMPDVNERLDQLGAQLLLQPEAFERWGAVDRQEGRADLWPPDKLQRGGWWMVQRHRSFRANVTPVLVGSLGELTFDGQALVAVAAPSGSGGLGLLGQPPDVGWAAVGPWSALDAPARELAEPGRRAEFERRAEGSAGVAARGGSVPGRRGRERVEVVACAEVELPVARALAGTPGCREALVASASAAVPGGQTQLVPALSSDGAGGAWLAWVACGERYSQAVVVARGDGSVWSDPVAIDPHPPRANDQLDRQWRPHPIATIDGVACAYLGFQLESWDVLVAMSLDGIEWSDPVRVDDADREPGVLRERGHDTPVLLADGGTLTAVWSDLRWPWVLPQVRTARSSDEGRSWSASERVDGGTLAGEPDPLAGRSPHETRGQAAPAVARAGSGTVVAWQELDARGRSGVWLARPAGGAGERGPVQLDDGLVACFRPVLAAAGRSLWAVWEEDDGTGGLVLRCSADAGASFGPTRRVPGGGVQRRAVVTALDDARAAIVFEDDRLGAPRIAMTVVDASGEVGSVLQVCDTPKGSAARAPAAALVDDELIVAWQDTRGGREHVRTVRVAVSAGAEVGS